MCRLKSGYFDEGLHLYKTYMCRLEVGVACEKGGSCIAYKEARYSLLKDVKKNLKIFNADALKIIKDCRDEYRRLSWTYLV